mmetsp:Transcript_4918/g.18255  ORF Transcript_4918/g.18255 Transcript_4918/m.18255 type:complete len:232 (-) Transcript_4918:47-742(-)
MNVRSTLVSSKICVASSRVGDKIRTLILSPLWSICPALSFSSAGNRNAIVFPLPVFARASTSAPPKMKGNVWPCTAVLRSKPLTSVSARSNSGHKSRSANETSVAPLPTAANTVLFAPSPSRRWEGSATAARPRRAKLTLAVRARGENLAPDDGAANAVHANAEARVAPMCTPHRVSPAKTPRTSADARRAAAAIGRLVDICRDETRFAERFGTKAALFKARGVVSIRITV